MTNKQILSAANSRLNEATYNPKKLILIHAGITALVTLLGSILSHLMTNSMDNAVGLAGIGTRTGLSFFRTILLLATTVAMPFWSLGYTRAAVLYAKGDTPKPSDLLTGFRRFFPALRMMLIQMAAIFVVLFLTVQLATTVFMVSPLGLMFMEQTEGILSPDMPMSEAILTEEVMEQLMPSLTPVYIIWAVLSLVALLFLSYRFRFAAYALMDEAAGARAAFRLSFHGTRRRWRQLVKLDLRFWWYYGLALLIALVSYLDVLLPMLGVAMDAEVAFWVFYLLGQVCNLALQIFCTPKIQTAYALFFRLPKAENLCYDRLRN